ncbi:MAG: hypothetical protein Q9171_004245 [Xanthocarpia ochracea]
MVKYISQIPCDIVQTLQNDANEAKKFIDQLEDGKVPSFIENLPEEIITSFKYLFGIFLTLPSDTFSVAEDTVESAVNLFNDIESGAIRSYFEDFDDKIVSGVTDLWGDFTAGLKDAWGAAAGAAAGAVRCFPTACAVSSDALGSCQGNTAATTTGNGGGPSATGRLSFQASVTSTFSSATPVQTPASMPSPTGNTLVLVPSFNNNTVVGVPSLTNNIPAGAPSPNNAPAGVPSANNPPASVPSPTDNTPTGQTSALFNPSAGASASRSSFQGASAKNLPGVFMLEGITKVCVLAALGLLELFVWL